MNSQPWNSPWNSANIITKIGMLIGSLGFTLLKIISYVQGQQGEVPDQSFGYWALATIIVIFIGTLMDIVRGIKETHPLRQLVNMLGLFILYLLGGIIAGLILVDLIIAIVMG